MEIVKDDTEKKTTDVTPSTDQVQSDESKVTDIKTEPTVPGKGKRKAQIVTKEIREEYTDAEITKMARRMAAAMKEKEGIKDEAKIEADKFKTRQNVLDAEIEELGNIINNGFQYVTVECSMVKNFDTQLREFSYKGKIIETEPLTSKDHQLDIEDAEAANKKENERIAKEEAKKKTAELNEQAANAVAEESALSEGQIAQFDEFIKSGDESYKLKNYEEAKTWYMAAAKFKPNDKALNNKLLKTQNWLDKKAAEEK